MKDNVNYLVAEGVHHRVEEFGLMIISKTTPILLFNDDMKMVWEMINSGLSYNQIISSIKNSFSDSEIEAKVDKIIDTLLEIGLIYENKSCVQ